MSAAFKTDTQVIPEIQVKGSLTNIGSTVQTIYTCPAGKKAKLSGGTIMYVALGANTFWALTVAALEIRRLAAANTTLADDLRGLVLIAGDTIQLSGDNAANNGTIRFILSIRELPA